MKVVVDTNIVFSAMLNTNSRIAQIILKPQSQLSLYSTATLKLELEEHSNKIKRLSGYTEGQFRKVLDIFFTRIRFIDPKLIPKQIYEKSLTLTHDVDIDDTEFVALTQFLKGRLWSGDKKLKSGLEAKGWKKFVTTAELFDEVYG